MDQLDQLLPQIADAGAELILVDNNSTDDTARLIQRIAGRRNVTAVRATAGQSVAYARNAGVCSARSDRLLFCDADDIVSDNWVRTLVDSLDTHNIVTGTLDPTALNSPDISTSRGTQRTPSGSLVSFYGLFPVAHGGNMAVTRKAWDDIGPLDESLSSIEDMEWSLRAMLCGHPIVHAPGATIGYRYRTQARDLWRQGFHYGRYRPVVAQMTYRQLGTRPRRLAGIRSWVWLACHLGGLRSAGGRAKLAWVAGNRFGNLVGSVRTRFLLL